MPKLTQAFVDGLGAKPLEYARWDAVVVGLGLRVRPSGKASNVFRYRAARGRSAPVRKLTIGPPGCFTHAVARDLAAIWRAEVLAGRDPRADRVRRWQEANRARDRPPSPALRDARSILQLVRD